MEYQISEDRAATESAWWRPWDAHCLPSQYRDVMGAGWSPSSFAAWAWAMLPVVLSGGGVGSTTAPSRVIGLQGQMPEDAGTPVSGQTEQECLKAPSSL